MSKPSKPQKKTVELPSSARPSRIRRDPVRVADAAARKPGRVDWASPEWETRLAVAGIIFFGVAISALVIDVGELLSR